MYFIPRERGTAVQGYKASENRTRAPSRGAHGSLSAQGEGRSAEWKAGEVVSSEV